MIEMLAAKIHRATITDTNVEYEGSITISKNLLQKANLLEYQKVTVADVTNGSRFETYIISSEKHGIICVNGAAAHLVSKNDKIIIMSYGFYTTKQAKTHIPIIVHVDENNNITNSNS